MGSKRSNALKIVKTAGLILLDSMIFHEVVVTRVNPSAKTLSQILSGGAPIKVQLEQEWSNVVKMLNYGPVFEPAIEILRTLPSIPQVERALRHLINLAMTIAASKVLLRHDLFGRIYHTLLLGKLVKYYATLYTSIPAARLLASLIILTAFHRGEMDVTDPRLKYMGRDIRVVDFAVGSGTLLSAIYKELLSLHLIESSHPNPDELHKYLIEDGLWGFDVLYHAIHLASTSLLFHNPTPVSRNRLYVCPLSDSKLGSLEFLNDRCLGDIRVDLQGRQIIVAPRYVTPSEIVSEPLCIEDYDIVIMNPPFTRSVGGNLLFGSLPGNLRKKATENLKRILRQQAITGILKAGLGAVFSFLADKYLRPGGRLGLVLPRALLSGIAWAKVRDMLLRRYHLEYIVTSYEGPNSWNFSENTNLSEVLVVARKLKEGEGTEEIPYTIFINLWRRPRSELDSIHISNLAKEIYRSPSMYDIENPGASSYPLKIGGRVVGEIYAAKVSEDIIGVYNFFAQSELNRVVLLLRRGVFYAPSKGVKPLNIRFIKLSSIMDIGPDVKQVEDTFSRVSHVTPFNAFWDHDSDRVRTIGQAPNKYLQPKPGMANKARTLWAKSAKLLLVERAWLETYRVLAVLVDSEVLSNVWWPLKLKGCPPEMVDNYSKVLSLWFNSTFGMLLMLPIAEVTRGPWIKFKKGNLKELLVIDPRTLNNDHLRQLLSLYDEIEKNGLEFKPLPTELAEPDLRRKVDEVFCDVLGVNPDYLDDIYPLMARDPMITRKALGD